MARLSQAAASAVPSKALGQKTVQQVNPQINVCCKKLEKWGRSGG